MYKDYLDLMLMNLVAAFFLLAHFSYKGLKGEDYRNWAPGFGLVGFIALVTGFSLVFVWPLPGSYNIVFGTSLVLIGGLYFTVAVAFARGWKLTSLCVFAFFAGVTAIVFGARLIDLDLTKRPVLSGIGFIISGAAALMASAGLGWPGLRGKGLARWSLALLAVAAGVIWAITAFDAVWGHVSEFTNWSP
jgi:putative membrane protein